MKSCHPTLRFVVCAIAVVSITAPASALTISYSGVLTYSDHTPPYAVGDSWELTAIFPDPLTALPGGVDHTAFTYVPSSMSVTINGVVRESDFPFDAGLLATHDFSNPTYRYYNFIFGTGNATTYRPLISVALGSSYAVVTASDGLLLPGIPMDLFDINQMFFGDRSDRWVIGVVTGYSVPDAASTMALLGFGIAVVVFLRRRFSC